MRVALFAGSNEVELAGPVASVHENILLEVARSDSLVATQLPALRLGLHLLVDIDANVTRAPGVDEAAGA